jgi:hypothetical protein
MYSFPFVNQVFNWNVRFLLNGLFGENVHREQNYVQGSS